MLTESEAKRGSTEQVPAGGTPDAVERASGLAPAAAKTVAALRIMIGLTFLWAFLDKTFGLGYATTADGAWINGGSPTKGFLSSVDVGPLQGMLQSWAGQGWADWLFMLGLAGVGLALVFGVGLRIAAVSGTVMMLLMWAAEWPLDRFAADGEPSMSTNPIIDYHLIYAMALVVLAVVYAGNTWGFGRRWAGIPFVRRNRWLL